MASKSHPSPIPVTNNIGTTRHEQAAALLSSVLLLVGVVTSGMFVAWLSATVAWNRPSPEVHVEDTGGGAFGDSRTGSKELIEPGSDEVKELGAPERTDTTPELVALLVSTKSLDLNENDIVDSLRKGPPGSGPKDGLGAWERWEIKFSPSDISQYASQLDFFKVELGVAGGGIDVIHYCSRLSSPTPTRREGSPKNEKRLFFLFQEGSVRQADRELARKAGIDVSDRVVFQFYTPEMYKLLLKLENERMRSANKRISEVQKTTFGVRGASGQWEIYILDQKYRTPLPFKS
jgi:hypothetical protein